MKTNRNNKTNCQLVRYTVLTRGGRAKSRMDNVGRGDWSPQPDCYPVELPPARDAVSWKKFNPREQAAILIPDCLSNAGLSLTQRKEGTSCQNSFLEKRLDVLS